MGIEEDIKDIKSTLLVIKDTLCLTYGIEPLGHKLEKEKAQETQSIELMKNPPKDKSEEKNNVSDKKDKDTKKPEPKKEIDTDEPILYTCTNCGVSFAAGEEHTCKTK